MSQPAEKCNAIRRASRKVCIALGNFMTSAALVGINACSLEGIVPAQYGEIFALAAGGYRTVNVATAGYRGHDDKYATLP